MTSDLTNNMLWSAATSCFFNFLRSDEVTIPNSSNYDPSAHLNFADISEDNSAMPSIVQVRTKASKTDPFRQGVNVHIGRTGNDLCPVTALLVYLAARGNAPGLLFRFEDGSPLTKNRFVTKFRSALTQVGIDGSLYSGHIQVGGYCHVSFRQTDMAFVQCTKFAAGNSYHEKPL